MKYIVNFLKGIAIGIATIVPGMSGGTMALILGVYDKIIHSVSSFFKSIKSNIIFLAVVGAGAVAGVLAFSYIIDAALGIARYPTIFLFLGIIIGGIPFLYKKAEINKVKKADILPFAIAVIIVVVLSFGRNTVIDLAASTGILNIVFLFIAGILLAIALILPGISGTFFLLALGLYMPVNEAIKNLNIVYLLPLASGTAFGIILTTRVIEILMEKKKRGTYISILGFVIGSLIVILKDEVIENLILTPIYGFQIVATIIFCAAALAAGYFITQVIRKTAAKYNIDND